MQHLLSSSLCAVASICSVAVKRAPYTQVFLLCGGEIQTFKTKPSAVYRIESMVFVLQQLGVGLCQHFLPICLKGTWSEVKKCQAWSMRMGTQFHPHFWSHFLKKLFVDWSAETVTSGQITHSKLTPVPNTSHKFVYFIVKCQNPTSCTMTHVSGTCSMCTQLQWESVKWFVTMSKVTSVTPQAHMVSCIHQEHS